MQRGPNPFQQEQKRKEIDFLAVDRLLEYTKATHQNRPINQANDYEKEKESQRQFRPNSLTQRISSYETNQQIKKERFSFQDLDFCKIVMFLMAVEIERLREIIDDQQSQEQIRKNFEGMQQSINQWRLRYEQKEVECDELREELLNQKQNNKENIEKNIETLYSQIEQLKLENQDLHQKLLQSQNEIFSNKSQLQTKKNQLEQCELQNKQLKEEIMKLQNQQDKKYLQFIDELNNEIENLQANYKKLYNDYLSYKSNQSFIYDQQTQVPTSRLQSQQQQHYYQENQEINMLNSMIQHLQNENAKLRDDLFKQSRRSETWCC